MFIIDLNYLVPLEQLDEYIVAHRQYLDKYYNTGRFIASGAKIPRTGGIILSLAGSAEELEQIITEDPFYQHNLAEFKITQFLTSKHHPALADLLK
ncbi:YciI family protein [Mucilaginibacter sp.]|uniref:YciI family protein n=1 Tax=Mucilaginibacter sp. TaxID=1882438 RepID=UPI0028456945|nr:YciI family protein [Mucilaginibacter sp.]MDR3696462.1 YciI family protein [Mucilaginibacter sp.]